MKYNYADPVIAPSYAHGTCEDKGRFTWRHMLQDTGVMQRLPPCKHHKNMFHDTNLLHVTYSRTSMARTPLGP